MKDAWELLFSCKSVVVHYMSQVIGNVRISVLMSIGCVEVIL